MYWCSTRKEERCVHHGEQQLSTNDWQKTAAKKSATRLLNGGVVRAPNGKLHEIEWLSTAPKDVSAGARPIAHALPHG